MSALRASLPFRLRAVAFLLTSIFFWGVGPLFVKFFSSHYDRWTQNAFRYACAAAILLALAVVRRTPLGGLSRTQWAKLFLVALPNVLLQTAFASIYYYIYPSVASLVMRTDILIVCVLSVLFFHDERRIVRSPFFLAGAGIGLAGLALVIQGQDPEILERLDISRARFWIGVGMAAFYALFLALYTLAVKRLVRDVHPIASFTHVAWMTALALACLMLAFGRPMALIEEGLAPPLLMLLSALLCIVVAHTALYAALREIKVVVSTTLMFLTPVVTCVASAIAYGDRDRLSSVQIAGGMAVLAGAWLAAMAQIETARDPNPPVETP